jgi:riboflavin kinase / FMN adenylyltransferase
MQKVRLTSLEPLEWPAPVVTVGNFDGVHRGHQALVKAAVEGARETDGLSVVLSFDPHPSHVLSPDRAPEALVTVDQKEELLAGLGVDRLVLLPFTVELSNRAPADFAEAVLRGALGARRVVVGSNFRFGRGRSGDVALLKRLGGELGFDVVAVEPVFHEGSPISSTRIREALARGAVRAAHELLGRPFFVDGDVVRGDGRGRTIGIPTANLALRNETLPRPGVYAATCRVLPGGGRQAAVVNLGRRPTFGGGETTLEAHLLDFDGDLYGALLRVEFRERLRDEKRFDGKDALVRQIRDDIETARRVLAANGAVLEKP